MSKWTVSQLAKQCKLSRSTLLYYDQIGLLQPSNRTGSGYRMYSETDRVRLERICNYRQAGLSLEDIGAVLASGKKPTVKILEQRLEQIGRELQNLRQQQRLITGMLKHMAAGKIPATVNKSMWVSMLRSAGMDEAGMAKWHHEFEERAPQAHHEFLISLGISENETHQIRQWSKQNQVNGK